MTDFEDERDELPAMITRREAILRVSALLGGVALVGGSALLTGCRDGDKSRVGSTDTAFTADDVAFLDEVAETILPQTTTPGAKAAKTGAFMALIVTDSYSERDQKVFRAGMRKLDDACRKMNGASFMVARPEQRLALLQALDKEQKAEGDTRKAEALKKTQAFLTQTTAPVSDVNAAPAITADAPRHYFRMMKELALLGYFTSEIGCTQAQRYVEAPGKFEPCLPYHPGEKAWAAHA